MSKDLAELPVLIVDDEHLIAMSFDRMLQSGGFSQSILCHDGRDVLPTLRDIDIGVILLDLKFPHMRGDELIPLLSEQYPEVPVIVVTGSNEVKTAVNCMKHGAYDYLSKPVDQDQLILTVRRAYELRTLRDEYHRFREISGSGALSNPEAFSDIVAGSEKMHALFQYAEVIAPSLEPVLITGDTGVGKELVAKSIHRASGLKGPFVALNVAGLDTNLFSDTLFGHVKGAFTDAHESRKGLVERASGGTLFLDEIGDLSRECQTKLLRLLQEREYYALGSNSLHRSRARIIVATNCDLEELQKSGKFRKDLYFRIRTHQVHVPALRERNGDIPILLDHFLEKAAKSLGKTKPTPSSGLIDLLRAYDYPGNVRELEIMVFDAVSRHRGGMLATESFRTHIHGHDSGFPGQPNGNAVDVERPFALYTRLPTLRAATESLISEALDRANGNQTVAAGLLGMTRAALNKRLTRAKK